MIPGILEIIKNRIKLIIHKIRTRLRPWRHMRTFLPSWPSISVLVPVYNTDPKVLKKCIESVLRQKYLKWELCIVDDASTDQAVLQILKSYNKKSFRIKVHYKTVNKGIADTINKAASLATGDYIGVLDHDDELEETALYEYGCLIRHHRDADCIYCDEDKIDEKGRFCDPWYKPDWNPDLSLSFNYVMHFALYRRQLFNGLGGVRKKAEGSQDYDLLLRASEKTGKIYHINRILYHWRKGDSSISQKPENKPAIFERGLWALNDALRRRDLDAVAVHAPDAWPGVYRVIRRIKKKMTCSIIIRFKGNHEGLARLLKSIQAFIGKEYHEIIVCCPADLDMNQMAAGEYDQLRVVREKPSASAPKAFNTGVKAASGEVLFFLDDDMALISPESYTCLLEHVQRDETGAAGGKIYHDNRLIEHAGIILGPFNILGYAFRATPDDPGYVGLKNMTGNYSAVMGLGMMTRKLVFNMAGGFDETFENAYWDTDYCLRLRDKNFFITYTPYAKLIHHIPVKPVEEMIVEPEASFFREKWQHIIDRDPFFNPNLTRMREDFTWEEKNET